ncbi:MAG: phosphotransferase domain-containing protein [Chloroflexi bacterium OLB14]|nr:MAG: phosphotransferase domain-containing protein [Chloroflexi bacterium OLB14]
MLKLEFHCHTNASKDSLTKPIDLIKTARKKGLDRVVVTDHNSILGAVEAHSLDPQLVIVGEEIMTTRGELLAAYVQEEIPAGLTPQETIKILKEQGAFISVSHPFDRLRKGGWDEKDLLDIIHQVDAIEIFNARCMNPMFNVQAQQFAEKYNLAGTVGSDAHVAFEVGTSLMELNQFDGPDEMRKVIKQAKYKMKLSPWWVHLFSRYASMKKKKTIALGFD